ncbi:glycerol dehydrogenase [Gallaecimonas mangrovi]|uniref:glycerol dehydrogenase n=1 Tax=Gallaecimonas mangrovi TaxID=2291597 RepID=UPI000E20C572|nr:glycerol dehydrogenase [Gallaecimonas mangrovi]
MSKTIFSSPGKYIQGFGILSELGEHLKAFGSNALLVADDIVWGIVGDSCVTALETAGVSYTYNAFSGEASTKEIARIAAIAKENGTNLVVGIGGGKTLDTVKAVADDLKQPVVIVPTVASTDAPCSALSVIYSEDGVFESYRFYNKNPDLVFVDSQVCVKAPLRLFASGIADGLATYAEALAVQRTNSNSMVGGRPSIAGMAIARACEETLLTHGVAAYEAVSKQLVTPAVEAVIEANTLLSGLGFENGGLAGAHAIHNGFTAVHGDIHKMTHGEKVAYGTLTQMVLENRPLAEIEKYIRFYRAIGMPTTLKDLHLEEASYEELLKIGELAGSSEDTLQNLNDTLTPDEVAQAILAVDRLSNALK